MFCLVHVYTNVWAIINILVDGKGVYIYIYVWVCCNVWLHTYRTAWFEQKLPIGSILNPLAGKFSEDTRKKGKGAKAGASHDWRSFYLSQYDWLKGSHMTRIVWLPNETDYSYCEFVAPNTPNCPCILRPHSQSEANRV